MTRTLFGRLLVATIVAYVGFFLVSAVIEARAERHTANQALAAATAASNNAQTIATNSHNRVNSLSRQIHRLQVTSERRSRQIGRLETGIQALSRQLDAAGIQPVIVEHHTTVVNHPPAKPAPHPHRKPKPKPPHHGKPKPRVKSICIQGVCLPKNLIAPA